MSAGVLGFQMRRLGFDRPGPFLLAAGVAGWTALVTAAVLGRLGPTATLAAYLLMALVPLAFLGRILFWRTAPPAHTRLLGAWTGIVGAALVFAQLATAGPLVALTVPGILVLAVVCGRFPAVAVLTVFLFSAAYGSLTALTPLPAGQVIDALLVGLWISVIWTYLLRGRDRPVWVWPGVVLVGLYIALTACEIVTGTNIGNGFYAFRDTSWYILTFLLVGYAWWRPGTRELVAKGVVAVALVVGLYACYRYLAGPAAKEYTLAAQTDRTNVLDSGGLRLVGSFISTKGLAAWAATVTPFCVAFALAFRGPWRLIALGGAASLTFALVATEVRTGIVGVITGVALVLLLYMLSRAWKGPRLGITVTATLAVLIVGFSVFSFTLGRSDTSTERYTVILTPTRDAAFQARLLRWRTVLADIDENPFGQGLGTSGRVQRERGRFANISSYDIDNSYLQIAFEQGFGMMVFFIAASLTLLVSLAQRAITTPDPRKAGIAIGACGVLWAYLTILPTGSYLEGLGTLAAWLVVGLGVGQFATREPAGTQPATDSRGAGA